ncbi:MAG TPA: PD-(D/E)XK nuclease family protein, partial [Actinotalea sp.]|nr:PD-(D/E)XK nuclease family protein [Actinotalea sp.]
AGLLAHLAARGVEGADPTSWLGTRGLSTAEPLWPAAGPVPLSPSRVELARTCGLRWALETVGGAAASTREQSLGTLVHAVAAALPRGSAQELQAMVDARWAELGLPEGWLDGQARRRARAMVTKLAAYLASAAEPVGLETSFTARVGRVELHGQVDRLERVGADPAGRPLLRVVDLKTGKNPVSGADGARHPQLGVYQAAVAADEFDELAPGARPAGASLVYVGTATQNLATSSRSGWRTWSSRWPTW